MSGKKQREKEYVKMNRAFWENLVYFYKTEVFPVVRLAIYRRKLDKSKIIC